MLTSTKLMRARSILLFNRHGRHTRMQHILRSSLVASWCLLHLLQAANHFRGKPRFRRRIHKY